MTIPTTPIPTAPGAVVVRAVDTFAARVARSLQRPAYVPTVPEFVTFRAPCDRCGVETWWRTEREDGCARHVVTCPCGGAA